jgi:hypothetical protein
MALLAQLLNPLKTKRREREKKERRKWGWVVRDTTFNTGGRKLSLLL